MAIRGVNLKEQEEVIHPDDPGHPDNIAEMIADKELADIAADKRTSPFTDQERADLTARLTAENKPTIYFIGNLTANDRVEFGDMNATPTMRDGGITMDMRNTRKAHEVVKRGLKGWDNQQDHEGNQVAFKAETAQDGGSFAAVVSAQCMLHLPQEVIGFLSTEIQRKNGMTNDLVKKLQEQSPLSKDLNSVIGHADPAVLTSNEPSGDAQGQPSES